MIKLTGYNLINFIAQLPKNRTYNYVNSSNRAIIRIVDVNAPMGPIKIKRWNPSKGETEIGARVESISTEMIWRLANAFFEGQPINVDRVFGASYNTRSVLEALLAHTPQFYFCFPGRIKDIAGHTSIEHGHKHLIWLPANPHQNGELVEYKVDMAISEIPSPTVVYDSLAITNPNAVPGLSIEQLRRHTEMQVALYLIAKQLGCGTWIARNDSGIIYKDKPLLEHEGIIRSLDDVPLVGPYNGAAKAANLIDCIWFYDDVKMPAVIEVEHSTGVTSGLDRMLNFKRKIPNYGDTKYVVVASDDDRDEVIEKANKPAFRELDTRFFPYSAVEELYDLCNRRKITWVNDSFLDSFMEPILVR